MNGDWDSARETSHTPDPRIVEFVRVFARWVADKDYDRLIAEGKQPWEQGETNNG